MMRKYNVWRRPFVVLVLFCLMLAGLASNNVSKNLNPASSFIYASKLQTMAVIPASNSGSSSSSNTSNNSCSPCSPSNDSFFGLDSWYAYLKNNFCEPQGTGICGFHDNFNTIGSNGQVSGINSSSLNVIWLIGLAIFDDLLRIAGIVAIGFVIYGGIRYITSQGEPEATKAARETIINALIGVAIAVIAAATISFIGSQLGG